MWPHLSNETGSETRWSESVHISKSKLGTKSGDQVVSTSLKRNWEGDQVMSKCNSQFHSRDIDTSCPPGLTPCFVREIWTLPDRQDSLPVSC
jgi:hypothetical protein